MDTMAISAEFKCLLYSCGYWKLPKNEDIKIIKKEFIFMGPCTPQDTRKLKEYKFEKDNMTLKMFKAVKFEK